MGSLEGLQMGIFRVRDMATEHRGMQVAACVIECGSADLTLHETSSRSRVQLVCRSDI